MPVGGRVRREGGRQTEVLFRVAHPLRSAVAHVVYKVLRSQPHRVAVVVSANLELVRREALSYTSPCPRSLASQSRPVLHSVGEHTRASRDLKVAHKRLPGGGANVHSRQHVLHSLKAQHVAQRVSSPRPLAFADRELGPYSPFGAPHFPLAPLFCPRPLVGRAVNHGERGAVQPRTAIRAPDAGM